MPVTMEAFLKHVQESSKAGSRRLAKEWVTECAEIVDNYRDSIESITPRRQVSCMTESDSLSVSLPISPLKSSTLQESWFREATLPL